MNRTCQILVGLILSCVWTQLLLAAPPSGTGETLPGSSGSAQHQTAELIRQLAPSLPDNAVQVLAEQYAGMSESEIRLLISTSSLTTVSGQSKASALFGPSLRMPLASPSAGDLQPVSATLQVIRQNLRHRHTVGYRAGRVFRIVGAEPSAGGSTRVSRNFAAGRSLRTGNPLHVRLRHRSSGPEPRSAVLLQLTDERLTCCGALVRTVDGRLAIGTPDGQHSAPLSNVREIPDDVDVQTLRIDHQGHVTTENRDFGHLPVVLATSLSRLQTTDGVFFTSSAPVRAAAPTEFGVLQYSLELSNVDVDRELQELSCERALESSQLPLSAENSRGQDLPDSVLPANNAGSIEVLQPDQ